MPLVLIPYLRALLLVSLVSISPVWAEVVTQAEIFKSPACSCCGKWSEHLQQNGFQISIREVNDIPAARKKLGMPDRLGSCHTAQIGDYVIEGHVPAADIQRLLKESPKALGLAVPSMPPGSPGMETANPISYETLLVQADGNVSVFTRH